MDGRDSWGGSDRVSLGHRARGRGPRVEFLEARIAPAVFTVTTTVDNGSDAAPTAGSLREAILMSNASGDPANAINFDIPGTGVQTIAVGAIPLPTITRPVLLDGLTQPGSSTQALSIQITGNHSNQSGLNLSGVSGSSIRGLVINNFGNAGIMISGGSGNRVQACVIGLEAGGYFALENSYGVVITNGSTNNVIGANGDGVTDVEEGNLISGNGVGVSISGAGTSGNRVAGNLIGVNALGTWAIGNNTGVNVFNGASNNVIGTNGDGVADAAEGNLISGNGWGVLISDAGTSGNRVAGNKIGTNADGTAAIFNSFAVSLIRGATRNIIGTNGDGMSDAVEGNLISGNVMGGAVDIGGAGTSGNRVAGNKIGVDISGTAALPNGYGVFISAGATENIVGTNGDGVSDAVEGNLISGNYLAPSNSGSAVSIAGAGTSGNRVAGNRLGLNSTGTAAIPNGVGVTIIGDATGNIVGTNGDGVSDDLEGNYIAGNKNYGVEILVRSSDNRVAGNTISYNGVGIAVGSFLADNSIGNLITRNSIFKNKALGIDLGADGVTANGPNPTRSGPNQFLNAPVITLANIHLMDLILEGTAPVASNIELFIADPDPTGYGQGRTFLISAAEGSAADGDPTPGHFRFVIPTAAFPTLVTSQTPLTATATQGMDGDAAASSRQTSEFSRIARVTTSAVDLALTSTVDTARPEVGDVVVFTLTLMNNGPDAASGVRVSDLLPAGLAFVSAAPSQGTYNPTNGAWIVGGVGARQTITLEVSARVAGARATSSTAWIYAYDQNDFDATNNAVTTTLAPRSADLSVTSTSDRPSLIVGENATFTVEVHNAGPDDAGGVALKHVLPAGWSFVSAVASQGSYDPATGIWTVGTVADGSTLQLIVKALATAAGGATSTVVIAGSDRFDPNRSNDSSSTTVAVALPPVVTVDSLTRSGYRQHPTTLSLGFSGPLAPDAAEAVSNYTLTQVSPDGRRSRSIPLAGALYDATAHRVTLVPRSGRLALHARYVLIVHSGGVTDSFGRPIAGDGTQGGDYVRVIGPGMLTRPQLRPPSLGLAPARPSNLPVLSRISSWSRVMR